MNWQFVYEEEHLQIGNAVPTFLSQAIKNSVKSYLKKEDDGRLVHGIAAEPALF